MTSAPRYLELTALLRQQITEGSFALGEKLPPEVELASRFSVSRATLRRALAELESEGLLERRRRIGTVVISDRPSEHFRMAMRSFPEIMSLTQMSRLEILGSRHVKNGSTARLKGRESATGYWLEIEALRYLIGDPRPVSWLMMYVDGRYAGIQPHLNEAGGAVYQLLEQTFDLRISRLRQAVGAASCPKVATRPLGLSPNDPVIELDAELFVGEDLIEITSAVYDPARFRITSDVLLSGL